MKKLYTSQENELRIWFDSCFSKKVVRLKKIKFFLRNLLKTFISQKTTTLTVKFNKSTSRQI